MSNEKGNGNTDYQNSALESQDATQATGDGQAECL